MLVKCCINVTQIDKSVIQLSSFGESTSIHPIRDVGFIKFMQTEMLVKNLFLNRLFNRIY